MKQITCEQCGKENCSASNENSNICIACASLDEAPKTKQTPEEEQTEIPQN